MIMHSERTRLIRQVLQEQPGGLAAFNQFLADRDEPEITNFADDMAGRVCQLLQLWPEGRVGCDFAEHVLPIWNAAFPDDHRPRDAIVAKRRWFAKEIDFATLEHAMHLAQQAKDEVETEQAACAHVAGAAMISAKSPCDPAAVSRYAILAQRQAAELAGDDPDEAARSEAQWQLRHLIEVLSE